MCIRDDIKSSEKMSILNQFKIGGGRGSGWSVKFKIANSCFSMIYFREIRVSDRREEGEVSLS